MNENENLQPVEKLTPFTKMIMTIGTLPSSFYSSMTYYESMVWLYEYLKNQVIPTVNNNAEAVEELQEKYLELKNYIDTYFDNLDVQEEINNKLDAMAESGELTTLIGNYVDPIFNTYTDEVNRIIETQNTNINTFKNNVNTEIATIDDKVESATSGSPKGVYSTVSALTTDDPDHDYIYVVTEDGKWYYYNTSTTSWTAGGTYQSSEGDIPNYFEEESFTETITTNTSPTTNSGFVTKAGVIAESSSYLYYELDNIQEGDIINLTQYDSMALMTEVHVGPRFTCYYNGASVVEDAGSNEELSLPIIVPSGVTKVIFSTNSRYINPIISSTRNVTTTTEVLKNANNNHNVRRVSNGVPTFKGTKETFITSDELVIASRIDAKKNCEYSFYGKISTMGKIGFGHGKAEYGASYLEIDDTYLYVYYYGSSQTEIRKVEHGLTFKDYIYARVNVSNTSRGSCIIYTNGGSFNQLDFAWHGCNGDIKAWCTSGSYTNIIYTWTVPDLLEDVYIFGDSYVSLVGDRWTADLVNDGFNKFLVSGFGGANSSDELISLKHTLKIRQPKKLIWCLGMNDPDNGAINTSWKNCVDEIIDICEDMNIELILATIPNVPSVDNSYKNAYILTLDLPYIDFASAVGASSGTTWYDNMLSNDNVHPSSEGAIALMCMAVDSVPELLNK